MIAAAGLVVLIGALLAGGSAGSATSAKPGPTPATKAAAPHVVPFATTLTAPRRKPAPRQVRVPVKEGYDGCDHAYGDRDQCVPWRFPPGTAAGCTWLRAHGFGPLAVHKRDRHRLDTNRDGTACGPGDRP